MKSAADVGPVPNSHGHSPAIRRETKAGHGAGKPRAKVLDELTDTYSFLLWQLGMKGE